MKRLDGIYAPKKLKKEFTWQKVRPWHPGYKAIRVEDKWVMVGSNDKNLEMMLYTLGSDHIKPRQP